MKTQALLMGVAVTACASLVPFALAQAPGGRGELLLRALDRDNNGELSGEELTGAPEALTRLDRDRDGQLSGEELGRGGGGRPPRGGGGGAEMTLVPKYDANGDGILIGIERAQARAEAKRQREGGRRRFGGSGDAGEPKRGEAVALNEVETYPGTTLYDPSIIRTFFLEFGQPDWEDELADFYRSDVLVPATLIVDPETYPDIGVSFRGNSSFFTVRKGQKRSLNLVLDLADPNQNLAGYRTINLLNAHTDPSFLREVTYNFVARDYVPAPRANFVRLVINGEDWGIYVNTQQLNKEFTEEWFGSRKGVRWKIRAGGGARSLNDNGDDPEDYKEFYEAKSNESERAWLDLVRVCRELGTTPVEMLDRRLDRMLDVDRALWFLAMDNVLIDSDGYYARGSDYMIYQEPRLGRFHLLPYDSNETFRYPGGGGPGGGSRIQVEGVKLSPFAGEENEARPLLSRLMANPRIRARYLAHVRTIHEEWLESGRLEAQFETFHSLIKDHVRKDVKKLYPTEAFVMNLLEDDRSGRRPTPGLKSFARSRRDYFRSFPEFQNEPARIAGVEREVFEQAPQSGRTVGIVARLQGEQTADEMLLYYATDPLGRFQSVSMEETDQPGQFRGEIPAQPAGSRVFYYVESRRGEAPITSYFWPRNPILGARSYRVVSAGAAEATLVINEVMPTNRSVARDPQGDFDDWIEIHNPTHEEVDLSGVYLTDSQEDLLQWAFPTGAVIPALGYVMVWADGDVGKSRGYHAPFKLAGRGETVFLIDSDARGNRILDQMTYSAVAQNESFGRLDDGSLAPMPPTPGRKNR